MQVWQRPCRECLRVHRLGDLPDITRDLRIAFQVVNELGVRRSKQPFARRSEPRLGRRSCLLCAFVPRQQRLEISALKLAAPVYNQNLRKSSESTDAFPQGHHAGSIARRIERQVEGKRPARECVGEQRQPWPSQPMARAGYTLNVQLSVIDMRNLQWPVAVSRGLEVEVPVKRRYLIAGSAALALQRLIEDGSFRYGKTKGLVAWNRLGSCFANPFQPDPRRILRFLL